MAPVQSSMIPAFPDEILIKIVEAAIEQWHFTVYFNEIRCTFSYGGPSGSELALVNKKVEMLVRTFQKKWFSGVAHLQGSPEYVDFAFCDLWIIPTKWNWLLEKVKIVNLNTYPFPIPAIFPNVEMILPRCPNVTKFVQIDDNLDQILNKEGPAMREFLESGNHRRMRAKWGLDKHHNGAVRSMFRFRFEPITRNPQNAWKGEVFVCSTFEKKNIKIHSIEHFPKSLVFFKNRQVDNYYNSQGFLA